MPIEGETLEGSASRFRRRRPLKLLLFWLVLLSLITGRAVSWADTTISSNITADTTWTLAGSPYIVTGYITVQGSTSAGATLTIEPGVVIKFNQARYLNVGAASGNPGALIARGTAASPITFTSNQTTPTAGYWNQIKFDNTSNDATTILEYCTIQYGGGGGYGGINIQQAAPTIRNSTINNSSSYGIYIYNSTPTVNSCQFNSNGNYDLCYTGTVGGMVQGCDIHNGIYIYSAGTVAFAGNTIHQNNSYPIKIYANNAGPIVSGSAFTDVTSASYIDIISGNVTKDSTWTSAIPYVIRSSLIIQGTDGADGITTLNIMPGARLKFASGQYLQVGANSGAPGALKAEGTGGSPILFTSNQPNPASGDWQGIRFLNTTADASTAMRYCIVEYAGCQQPNTLWCTIGIDSSAPTLQFCEFKNNKNYDLYYSGAAVGGSVENCIINKGIKLQTSGLVSFVGNTINYDNGFPIKVYPDNLHHLVNDNAFLNVNSESYIEVGNGILTKDATWTAVMPYLIRDSLVVQGTDGADGITTLSLAPGARLKFAPGQQLQIGANSGAPGALNAVGTPDNAILFSSSQANPTPGDWLGIRFLNTTADASTVMRYCTVEYAGLQQPSTVWCTIGIDSSAPALQHCEFRNNKNCDLLFSGSAVGGKVENCVISKGINIQLAGTVHFSENTFNYDNNFPIKTYADFVGGIVHQATFHNLDAGSYLEVTGGNVSKDALWTGAIPYVFHNSPIIQGADGEDGITTLTISPGARLKFDQGQYLQIGAASGNPGCIKAEGTSEAPIVFTSKKATPAPGDWYGLRFLNTTADGSTILRHCNFEYTGLQGTGYIGTLYIENCAPNLYNCKFLNSSNYDLYYYGLVGGAVENCLISKGLNLQANGIVTFSGNTITYNNSFPIKLYADNVHSIVNNNTFNNLDAASQVEVVGGNITKDAIWTATIPYYILANPKVQGTDGEDGITSLTISPGARLKFGSSASLKIGDTSGAPGSLIAQGASDNMILFTSSRPSPAAGDWFGIHFYPTAQPGSLLDFCVIEYAGADYGAGYKAAIYSGTNMVVKNCIIRNCANFGMQIIGTANQTVVQCNTFQRTSFGLYTASTSTAIQSNNFLNNTNYGLYSGVVQAVVAENSWWGDTAGPNKAGDKTYGNVDYDPWATALIQCVASGSNAAPYTPAGPQPADNAVRTTIPSSGLILTWSGGDPDPMDTVTYDIYRGPTAEKLSRLAFNITGTTYKMTDLQRGITYYWKVIARDNRGLQTQGPVWRFTATGDTPDLIVAGMTTTPPGHLQPGQSVTLTAKVQNISTGPVVDTFSVSFKAGGAAIGTPTYGDIIPAGATVQVSQAWTCTTGDPSLEVMADAQRQVPETNEQNNQFIALLSEVADNTPPSLTATSPANGAYLQHIQQITVTLADSQSAIDDDAVLSSFIVAHSQGTMIPGGMGENNDTFIFTPALLPLSDDTYHITVTGTDIHGNTRTNQFLFTIDTAPPEKPVITGGAVTSGTIQPRPAQNTSDQFVVQLTGTREAGTAVWINGINAAGYGDIYWSAPVNLQPGANAIEVWIVDRAGNRSQSEWVDITVIAANTIEYEYNTAGRIKKIRPADQQP